MEKHKISIVDISVKVTNLGLQANLLGDNELSPFATNQGIIFTELLC